MSDDDGWVELLTGGYICEACCDSLIASIYRGKVETMKHVPARFAPRKSVERTWTL